MFNVTFYTPENTEENNAHIYFPLDSIDLQYFTKLVIYLVSETHYINDKKSDIKNSEIKTFKIYLS